MSKTETVVEKFHVSNSVQMRHAKGHS